jgi:spore germination protein YaaH
MEEGSRITFVITQPGQTLADLSERYGISEEELRELNRGIAQVEEGTVLKVREQGPSYQEREVRTHFALGFYTGAMGEDLPGSRASFERHSNLLSAIAPYWFDLDLKAQGQIMSRVSKTDIRSLIEEAHRRKVKVLASIHNTSRQTGAPKRLDVLHNVLTGRRDEFFANLFNLLSQYKFDGVNLDFEHLKPGDRDVYTDFVRELSARAHQKGYLVTVNVLGDANKVPYSLDFDYPGLAKHVDYLGIMTYDEHKPTQATPGPVASLPWVRRTLEKALQDGVPARKILLGIPFYGYDWVAGQEGATALSYAAVQRLQQRYKGKVRFHPKYLVPHMTYTDGQGRRHEVWYENKNSIALKLDLVKKYKVAGILIWRLGLEDPTVWSSIRAKLSPIE